MHFGVFRQQVCRNLREVAVKRHLDAAVVLLVRLLDASFGRGNMGLPAERGVGLPQRYSCLQLARHCPGIPLDERHEI